MIPSRLIQFPFSGGLNEGIDPRTAPPGTLKSLKNYAWTKDGRLEKRNGTERLTASIFGGGTITAAERLAVHDGQLCLLNSTGLYTLSDRAGVGWIYGGRLPNVGLTWANTTAAHADGIQAADIGVTGDGLKVVAYVKGDPTVADFATSAAGNLVIQLIEPDGRVRVLTSVPTNVNYCRVLINANDWIVVYSTSGGLLRMIDSAESVTTLRSDGRVALRDYVPFDAFETKDNSGDFILVYEDTPGNDLVIHRFTFAGAAVANDVVDTNGSYFAVGGVSTPEGNIYLVYGFPDFVRYAIVDESTLVISFDDQLYTEAGLVVSHVGACRQSATSATLMACGRTLTAPTSTGFVLTNTTDDAGILSAQNSGTYLRALSRPFILDGKTYMFMCDYSQTGELNDNVGTGQTEVFPGNNSYLARIRPTENNVSFFYEGLVDLTIAGCVTQGSLPFVAAISSTEMNAVLPYMFQASSKAFMWPQGLRMAKVLVGTSRPSDTWRSAQLGAETYIAGAYLTAFDGRVAFDFGFPRTTPIGIATSAAGVGMSMAAGDYRYQLVPVFPSAAGVKHRGPASPVVKFTVAATGKVDLFWHSKSLAGKQASSIGGSPEFKPYVEVYRTEVNLEVEHKLTVEPTYSLAFGETLTDGSADSNVAGPIAVQLSKRPGIYVAAEYDDYSPPASITNIEHRNRMFVVSGDMRTVWYSKDISEDLTVAPGFNPSAILAFDEDLTGLGSMDGRLVVLSRTSIWVVDGNGPAVSGDGDDYRPSKVQTDVGCINPRSCVSMPNGVMFQGQDGIYLLSRSLEVAWIGKPVQATLATYPNITSAVLVPALNQVRFTCNNDAGTEGVTLVFDHLRGQWSVFEHANGATQKTPIADAIMFDDAWTFVTATGLVYKETSANSLDEAEWVYGSVETTDLFADGPLSYQRVRRAYLLGERVSACDLSMEVYVEAGSAADQTRTWTHTELATIGSANVGVHVRRQKADAMRFRWIDGPPASGGLGTGQGLRFSAIGFEIAPKQGLEKRPATQRK